MRYQSPNKYLLTEGLFIDNEHGSKGTWKHPSFSYEHKCETEMHLFVFLITFKENNLPFRLWKCLWAGGFLHQLARRVGRIFSVFAVLHTIRFIFIFEAMHSHWSWHVLCTCHFLSVSGKRHVCIEVDWEELKMAPTLSWVGWNPC